MRAGDRSPFGDRQTGIGQARRSAHQDHRADKSRHHDQPPEHAAMGVGAVKGLGMRVRHHRPILIEPVARSYISDPASLARQARVPCGDWSVHEAFDQDWPDCLRLTLYVNAREERIMSLETFRKETKDWLEANCPASMRQPIRSEADICWGGRNWSFASEDQKLWLERMAERGWTVPTWPTEYGGGGLSKDEAFVLKEEMKAINARSPLDSFGIWMLGPALLKYGTHEQKLNIPAADRPR
jgi:hypothetical protein